MSESSDIILFLNFLSIYKKNFYGGKKASADRSHGTKMAILVTFFSSNNPTKNISNSPNHVILPFTRLRNSPNLVILLLAKLVNSPNPVILD